MRAILEWNEMWFEKWEWSLNKMNMNFKEWEPSLNRMKCDLNYENYSWIKWNVIWTMRTILE